MAPCRRAGAARRQRRCTAFLQPVAQVFHLRACADVIKGRAPAEFFKGAWVLVGATAFGIGDAVPTPHGGAVGGVEVHAQFITALLDNRCPIRRAALLQSSF